MNTATLSPILATLRTLYLHLAALHLDAATALALTAVASPTPTAATIATLPEFRAAEHFRGLLDILRNLIAYGPGPDPAAALLATADYHARALTTARPDMIEFHATSEALHRELAGLVREALAAPEPSTPTPPDSREVIRAIRAFTVDMPNGEPNGPTEAAFARMLDAHVEALDVVLPAIAGEPHEEPMRAALKTAGDAISSFCELHIVDLRNLRIAADGFFGGDFGAATPPDSLPAPEHAPPAPAETLAECCPCQLESMPPICCTLPRAHRGPHVAHRRDGSVLATWDASSPSSPSDATPEGSAGR